MAKKVAKGKKKKSTIKKSAGGGSIADELVALQEEYESSEEQEPFVPLPDSDYQGVIAKAEINKSRSSGRLQVSWHVTVEAPEEYAGRTARKHDGIETAENLGWLKAMLTTLGLEHPESLSDLPTTLENALGLKVNFTLQTKDEFQNLYINEVILEEEEGEENEKEEESEEEETEEEEGDEIELEKGMNVTFEDADGKSVTGTIKKVKDDSCEVEQDNKAKDLWDLTMDEFELA